MAAKSQIEDDSKVMDVSKPGKGKIISTSRPIIVQSKTPAQPTEDSTVVPEKEVEEALLPPSARQKVIQPTDTMVADAKEADDDRPQEGTESDPGASDAAVSDTTGTDTAGVDELAKSVVDKKKAAEESRLEADRDQHVQELIDSKQYFVPIGRPGSTGGGRKWVAAFLALLILLAGGYLLVDAGVFGSSIKLPVEFISDGESSKNEDKASEPSENSTKDRRAEQPRAVSQADDDDAKNELRNLQVKLEAYYNDAGDYPMSLTDLQPMPAADELQNSQQESYTYTTDGQTYTLGTVLSDGTQYTLVSAGASN